MKQAFAGVLLFAACHNAATGSAPVSSRDPTPGSKQAAAASGPQAAAKPVTTSLLIRELEVRLRTPPGWRATWDPMMLAATVTDGTDVRAALWEHVNENPATLAEARKNALE